MNIQAPTSNDREEAELSRLVQSIEKSRKRHLSVGLLRGDLVQDRLRQQEETASPLLKKQKGTKPTAAVVTPAKPSHPEPEAEAEAETDPDQFYSPTGNFKTPPRSSGSPARERESEMALTMADFKAYMDANTNKTLAATNTKLEGVDKSLAGVRSTVADIDKTVRNNSKRLDEQADNIRANDQRIQRIQAELENLKESGAPRPPRWPSPPTPGAAPALTSAQETDYSKARRSLRLWPISGNNNDELWEAAGIFLGTNLGLQGKLDKSNIEAISRVTLPSGPGVRLEALVLFTDKDVRDMVLGSAAKLAAYINAEGKPTAGMRIEVPRHLQTDFRILFKYGQGLRTCHGQGTRRHVKFCDVDCSLFLNVKLPGDEGWSRVSTEVAKRGLRAKNKASDGELERRLDITGEPLDRPRSASTSSAATTRSNSPSTSAWSTRRTESTST